MKKIISTSLLLGLALTLSACNHNANKTTIITPQHNTATNIITPTSSNNNEKTQAEIDVMTPKQKVKYFEQKAQEAINKLQLKIK